MNDPFQLDNARQAAIEYGQHNHMLLNSATSACSDVARALTIEAKYPVINPPIRYHFLDPLEDGSDSSGSLNTDRLHHLLTVVYLRYGWTYRPPIIRGSAVKGWTVVPSTLEFEGAAENLPESTSAR